MLTQIVDLPKGWIRAQLKDVCKIVTGTTPPKSDKSNYGHDFPFFKPPNLWDGVIDESEEMLSIKGASIARIVEPNTVLVTCIGNLGRTGFVRKQAAFNQQINAILESDKLYGKFIFYQAQSPRFRNQLESLATGTTVSIVNKGNFETIEIVVPPIKVQQEIVSKIEELFSELDKGIESLRIAQQQLKVYRQSVLKWAFEGEFLDSYKGAVKMNLGSVSKKIVVGYVGPITQHIVQSNGVKFLSTTHIGENEFLNHDIREVSISFNKKNIKSQAIPGDIMIARHGDSGKACIVPDWIEVAQVSNAVILRPDSNIVSSIFICFRLNYERIRMQKMKVGGVFQVVNTKSMEAFEVLIPSIKDQNLIVDKIEQRFSVADKMQECLNQSLQQAEVMRRSILKTAFEGNL